MFTINTENGSRSIAKSTSSWKFSIQNKDIIVNGADIARMLTQMTEIKKKK
jgi:ribonuclease P protein subunit POP4